MTDEPDALFAPGRRVFAGTADGELARHPQQRNNPESKQELLIEEAQPFKGGLIVKFDAIPDRTVAEQWRQRYLLVPMEELTPPGENELFMHELIGMAVQGSDGSTIGTVHGLYELPQGLTLEVTTTTGDILVPYRPTVVQEVDRDTRTVIVDVESGIFD